MHQNNKQNPSSLSQLHAKENKLKTKKEKRKKIQHTGKLVVVVVPQYLRAAKSYALAAFSSLS